MILGELRFLAAAWLIQHYEFKAIFVPCTAAGGLRGSKIGIKYRKLSISHRRFRLR